MKQFFLILLLCLAGDLVSGQIDSGLRPPMAESLKIKQTDTQVLLQPIPKLLYKPVQHTDSLTVRTDSVKTRLAAARAESLKKDSIDKAAIALPPASANDSSTYSRYAFHPYLPLHKSPMYMIIDYRKQESKDELFYLLAGVVFFLAFIKVAFPRYFGNLFVLFFQTSLRQKQTRDQLLQDYLASLLSNLLFVISTSLYTALIISDKGWLMVSFWWLALYSAVLLILVYTGKYLFLLFAGWVFNTKEAANSYIFIVFLVNKVIGILLVPFLLLYAFTGEPASDIALTVSVGLIVMLFFYRYMVSFTVIRNNLKVNALHFFLYLCAVELLPLVLIYKVLINYMGGRL